MNTQDKIRKALEESVPHWDHDGLWDKIDQQLPKVAKKTNRKPYLLGLLTMFVIALLFHWTSQSSVSIKDSPIHTIKNNPTSSSKIPSQKQILSSTTNNQENYNKKSIVSTKVKDKKKAIINSSANTIIHKKNSKNNNGNNKINKNNDSFFYGDQVAISNIGSESRNTFLSTDERINPKIRQASLGTLSSKNKTSKTINPFVLSNKDTNERPTSFSVVKDFGKVQHIDKLPSIAAPFKVKSKEHKFNLWSRIIPLFAVSSYGELDDYNISLSSSIYYTKRSMASDKYKEWIDQKNRQEQLLESSEVEFMIGKELLPNLSLKVGLSYLHNRSRFSSLDSTVAFGTVYSDSAYIYYQEGTSQYIPGEKTVRNITYRNISSTNVYQTLSLPIGVYYKLPIHKVHLELGLGNNINLWTKYNGYTSKIDGTSTNNENELEDIYQNSINLGSWFSSVNFVVPYQNYNFHLGLKYRSDIRSLTKLKDSSIKHHNYGITAGASMSL